MKYISSSTTWTDGWTGDYRYVGRKFLLFGGHCTATALQKS